jgi:hypothetical protein
LQDSLYVILIDEVPSKEVALLLEGDSILKEVVIYGTWTNVRFHDNLA